MLEIGLDVDQIYNLLGDPDHIDSYPENTLQPLTYISEDAADTTTIYIKKGKVTGWQK